MNLRQRPSILRRHLYTARPPVGSSQAKTPARHLDEFFRYEDGRRGGKPGQLWLQCCDFRVPSRMLIKLLAYGVTRRPGGQWVVGISSRAAWVRVSRMLPLCRIYPEPLTAPLLPPRRGSVCWRTSERCRQPRPAAPQDRTRPSTPSSGVGRIWPRRQVSPTHPAASFAKS